MVHHHYAVNKSHDACTLRIVLSLAFAVGFSHAPMGDAMAQACHEPSVLPGSTVANNDITIAAATQLDVATIPGGSFMASHLRLGIGRGRWALESALPMYSLQQMGKSRQQGLGDIAATLSTIFFHASSLQLRAAVTMTAPTGDDRASLGMGHWMVMPAVQAEATTGRLRGALALGAGAALGSGHVHRPGGPLVNPMNQTEATAMLRLAFQASPRFSPEVVTMAAMPLDATGTARMTQGVGATLSAGRGWRLRALFQLGLLGQPYISRLTIDVGVVF
jgi:hypothetical protein